jgi:hypothetical protein
MQPQTQLSKGPQAAAVLTKAVVRAAGILGLSQKDLTQIIGISPATASRVWKGTRAIEPRSKEGELALLFLRMFRSLDALIGGDAEKTRQWLRAENGHLGGTPARIIQTLPGLVHVIDYLDAMRGNL